MADSFSIISICLSLLASLFYLIGCLSNSDSQSTVKGTAWILYNEKVTLTTSARKLIESATASDSTVIATVHEEIWFGLKKFFFTQYSDDDHFEDTSSNESYDSDECSNTLNFCDTCKTDGKSAVGLVATALVLAVICAVLNIIVAASTQKSTVVKVFGVITSFLSFLFSLIAVCIFMGSCLDKIKNEDYIDSGGVSYGPGAILVIIGIIFMIVTFGCNLANLCYGSKQSELNESLAANQQHQTTIPVVTANPIATPVYVKN